MIHLIGATVSVPYPSWLNPADNTWQITAATFVGLMSLPGLAVLYASIVPKKWAVNVLAMMFAGFSLVLVAWVLWSYKMGFGATSIGGGVRNGCQTWIGGGNCPATFTPTTGGILQTLLHQLRGQTGWDHQ